MCMMVRSVLAHGLSPSILVARRILRKTRIYFWQPFRRTPTASAEGQIESEGSARRVSRETRLCPPSDRHGYLGRSPSACSGDSKKKTHHAQECHGEAGTEGEEQLDQRDQHDHEVGRAPLLIVLFVFVGGRGHADGGPPRAPCRSEGRLETRVTEPSPVPPSECDRRLPPSGVCRRRCRYVVMAHGREHGLQREQDGEAVATYSAP